MRPLKAELPYHSSRDFVFKFGLSSLIKLLKLLNIALASRYAVKYSRDPRSDHFNNIVIVLLASITVKRFNPCWIEPTLVPLVVNPRNPSATRHVPILVPP